MTTVHLPHNRVSLALHHIKEGTGRPLLMLHGLSESAANMSSLPVTWAGPIWALDFTGHGESTVPRGGGYSAEILMADVDVALRHIGEATLLGRGLGGYIAFLIEVHALNSFAVRSSSTDLGSQVAQFRPRRLRRSQSPRGREQLPIRGRSLSSHEMLVHRTMR